MIWTFWASIIFVVFVFVVFALTLAIVFAHPPQRSIAWWERIARRISIYETRRITCPWCTPPGSGVLKVAGIKALKSPPTEVSCGDCMGAGFVDVKLHKLSHDLRLREEQRWGIEKKAWEDDED